MITNENQYNNWKRPFLAGNLQSKVCVEERNALSLQIGTYKNKRQAKRVRLLRKKLIKKVLSASGIQYELLINKQKLAKKV